MKSIIPVIVIGFLAGALLREVSLETPSVNATESVSVQPGQCDFPCRCAEAVESTEAQSPAASEAQPATVTEKQQPVASAKQPYEVWHQGRLWRYIGLIDSRYHWLYQDDYGQWREFVTSAQSTNADSVCGPEGCQPSVGGGLFFRRWR